MQLTAQGGIPREVALKILLWASRRFKVSREIEDLIEAQPPPQDQGPSKEQTNIMAQQQKYQLGQQKMAIDAEKIDQEHRIKWAELELKQKELDQEKMQMLFRAQVDLGA